MPRGLRMFGHPVHAMGSHFPVALLATTTVWDALALLGLPQLWPVAYWTLIGGLVTALPAMVTGLIDFVGLPRDHPAETLGMRHLFLVGGAAGSYATTLALRGADGGPWTVLLLDGLGLGLLIAGAWHGAEMVLGHGVGRRDLAAGTEDRGPGSEE